MHDHSDAKHENTEERSTSSGVSRGADTSRHPAQHGESEKESRDVGDALNETFVPSLAGQEPADNERISPESSQGEPPAETMDRASEMGQPAQPDGKSSSSTDAADQDQAGKPTAEAAESQHANRYEPIESFAKGGLGKIWRARDNQIRRDVALKELLPRARRNRDLLERFMAEAQITGQLEHPGIVPIYELGFQPNGAPFYAMKLVHGVTLGEAIRQCHRLWDTGGQQRLAFARLLRNFIDVCNAVAFAHDHGVLHRDLKPSNVMLGDFGETIVLDWGLAKLFTMSGQSAGSEEQQDSTFVSLAAFDEFSETFVGEPETNAELGSDVSELGSSNQHTSPFGSSRGRVSTNARSDGSETVIGAIVGTAAYMPPEQAKGLVDQLDQRSDIYSLGAILYEILTNAAPVPRSKMTETILYVIQGKITPPRERDRTVPRALNAICMKALAYERESRYSTALELSADVEAYLADEPVTAYPEPWYRRMLRWMRRHRSLVTNTISAGIIVLIALTAWSLSERSRIAGLRDQATSLLADARTQEESGDLQASREALSNALASIAAEPALRDLRNSIDGQIQSVDRLIESEESNRLLLLRRKADERVQAATAAKEAGDLQRAQTILAALIASIDDEPQAADIGRDARQLKADVDALVSQQQARQDARTRFARFHDELDQARFYGSYFTAENIEQDVQEAQSHATTALELYGLDDLDAADGRFEHLADQEIEGIKSAALELMLVMAEAETTLARHADTETQSEAAQRAVEWTARAEQLGLKSKVLLSRKAAYLDASGEREAALASRFSAEGTDPSTPLDFFLLAEQARKTQRFEEALPLYRQALRLDPGHFWAMNFMGLCHLQRLHASAAVACYTSCISERPDFIWPYLTRAVAFAELKQFDDALADLARAIELKPTFFGIYINRGAVYLAQEQFDAAIADFERARELRSDRADAYINLGEAYRQLADRTRQVEGLQAAIPVFQRSRQELNLAADLAPYNPKTFVIRGDVSMRLADTASARRDFERAISLKPSAGQRAECHRQIGLIHHREGRFEEALAAYEQSLAASDADPAIYRLIGEVQNTMRRYRDAIAAFSTYLQKGTPEAEVYRARGLAYAQVGEYNDALGDYTRALELEPSPFMRTRRGWALLLQAAQLAHDDFEEAIKDNPQNPDSYIGRGYAKALAGDYAGGAADAEEGLVWARRQAAVDGPATWPLFHNAASVFAQAVDRVRSDSDLADDDQQKSVQRFATRAIETLQEAHELAGDANRAVALRTLKADEAFDPIRSLPEFRAAFPSATATDKPEADQPGTDTTRE